MDELSIDAILAEHGDDDDDSTEGDTNANLAALVDHSDNDDVVADLDSVTNNKRSNSRSRAPDFSKAASVAVISRTATGSAARSRSHGTNDTPDTKILEELQAEHPDIGINLDELRKRVGNFDSFTHIANSARDKRRRIPSVPQTTTQPLSVDAILMEFSDGTDAQTSDNDAEALASSLSRPAAPLSRSKVAAGVNLSASGITLPVLPATAPNTSATATTATSTATSLAFTRVRSSLTNQISTPSHIDLAPYANSDAAVPNDILEMILADTLDVDVPIEGGGDIQEVIKSLEIEIDAPADAKASLVAVPVPHRPEPASPLAQMEQTVQLTLRPSDLRFDAPLRDKRNASPSQSQAHRILKVTAKREISKVLSGENLHQSAGMPTTLAVHTKLIAIGTSHGSVLLFDHFEHLKHTLSLPADNNTYGAVTSLDISPTAEFLVAGFQGGQIVLWDVMSGNALKAVVDQHTRPLLHVRFFHSTKCHLLALDSGGMCNVFKFSKIIGLWRVEVSCILDGDVTGVVYDMAVLLPNENCPHPTDECGLVAFAAPKLVFVICCYPRVEMLYKLPRPPSVRASALPYLAWRRVMARDTRTDDDRVKDKTLHPVLCVGWGRQVRLVQVMASQQRFVDPVSHAMRGGSTMAAIMGLNTMMPVTFEFVVICQYASADAEFTGMEWLGEHVLLALNAKGQIRVLDPFAMDELDSLDINNLQMVFQAHFSSETDPSHKEYSFYNSFRCAESEMYLLGVQQLQTAKVLNWSDRLNALTSAGEWLDALALAVDLREGSAKAVVGLPRNAKSLQNILGKRMAELLDDYLLYNSNNAPAPTADPSKLDAHMKTMAGVTVDFCVTMERLDLLFTKVYPEFNKANRASVLLETIEPHILMDRVLSLEPRIMGEVLRHYAVADPDRLKRLERILLHLNPETLDALDHLIEVCRSNCLYIAMFHLYTVGLGDYFTPMYVVMGELRRQATTTAATPTTQVAKANTSPVSFPENVRWFGYLVLLYISKCIAGRAFPTNKPVPYDRLPLLKSAMFDFLFRPNPSSGSNGSSSQEQQQWETTPFENLFLLLHLDAAETLGVIEQAISDPDFVPSTAQVVRATGNPADAQLIAQPGAEGQLQSSTTMAQQTVLDTIMTLVLGVGSPNYQRPASSTHETFSIAQKGHAFHFLAKVLIQGKVVVSPQILQRTLLWLATSSMSGTGDNEKQQNTFMQLLESLAPAKYTSFKTDLVIALERSQFYKALVWLHDREGDFAQAVECHLKDPQLRPLAFAYIKRIMDADEGREVSIGDRERVKDKVLSRMQDLVQTDAAATANLIAEVFMHEHERVVRQLEAYPQLQYQYLKGVIDRATLGAFGGNASGDTFDNVVRSGGGAGGSGAGVRVAEREHERYLELMAQFDPNKVYPYLISHNTYRLDFALRVCEQHNIIDGASYLKERTGDVAGALKLITQTIFDCLRELRKEMETCPPAGGDLGPESELGSDRKAMRHTLAELKKAIAICERNSSQSLDEGENQQLWFRLLDTFAVPLRHLKKNARKRPVGSEGSRNHSVSDRMHAALNHLLATVINSMMGHVPFEAILEKMGSEYGQDEFGEFRPMLKGMLETYGFEKAILETAKKIWDNDLFQATEHLHRSRIRSVAPKTDRCGVCGLLLSEPVQSRGGRSDKVRVFGCTHSFHVSCMGSSLFCVLCHAEAASKVAAATASASAHRSASIEDTSTIDDAVQRTSGAGGGDSTGPVGGASAHTNTSAQYFRRLDQMFKSEAEPSPVMQRSMMMNQHRGSIDLSTPAGATPSRKQSVSRTLYSIHKVNRPAGGLMPEQHNTSASRTKNPFELMD